MSGASKSANGQACGPVLTVSFFLVLDHSGSLLFVYILLFVIQKASREREREREREKEREREREREREQKRELAIVFLSTFKKTKNFPAFFFIGSGEGRKGGWGDGVDGVLGMKKLRFYQ